MDVSDAIDCYKNHKFPKQSKNHTAKGRSRYRAEPVNYNGVFYNTQKEACEDLNVNYPEFLYFKRHHRELSVTEVLDNMVRSN